MKIFKVGMGLVLLVLSASAFAADEGASSAVATTTTSALRLARFNAHGIYAFQGDAFNGSTTITGGAAWTPSYKLNDSFELVGVLGGSALKGTLTTLFVGVDLDAGIRWKPFWRMSFDLIGGGAYWSQGNAIAPSAGLAANVGIKLWKFDQITLSDTVVFFGTMCHMTRLGVGISF
jgi:hypothetical protein